MSSSPFHGFLVIDKPPGLTSRDAVNRAQQWFPRGTRLGHTGTLDPLATGVLVLAVGSGTRLTEYVQDMDKVYQAGVMLGARSDSDDADGTLTTLPVPVPPDRAAVETALPSFLGEIDQVPPAYSAAKVTGRRAYDLARRGLEAALAPRRVRIYGIDVLAYDYPRLDLEVRCGKGTYIRALARDLGVRLGCGGYIVRLRRMRVGPFQADNGIGLDVDRETAPTHLLPLETAVGDLPRVELETRATVRFCSGGAVPLPAGCEQTGWVAVFAGDTKQLLGVGAAEQGRLSPRKIVVHAIDEASGGRKPPE